MFNPYANTDWSKERIVSLSHAHCLDDETLQRYASAGVQHFGISNYRPSVPRYPLSDWFENVPEDAISCPNAEHHYFTDGGKVNTEHFHMNAIGSLLVLPYEHEDYYGYRGHWKKFIKEAMGELLYADGGGITINHAKWSQISVDGICSILDYDDRVLGMEIWNHAFSDPTTSWMLDMWDEVLCTGRKCFGFAVPDWNAVSHPNDWGGFNFLICNATEHDCLKAYRNGSFYCGMYNDELKFDNIVFGGTSVHAETSVSANIKFVTARGEYNFTGTSATKTVSYADRYVRVEAHTDNNSIFSNPIMLVDYKKGVDDFIFYM